MKIIPAIDLMDGQVVRLFKGDPKQKTVYGDNPIHVAKQWQSFGADMIHLVDLDSTLRIGSNLSVIKNIIKELNIPIQVAGGLRDEQKVLDVSEIATRVVLGTLAFKDKPTLKKLLDQLGSEKIVISIDHFDGDVAIDGWQEKTNTKLIDAIEEFVQMGFTEFLVTNVNRDGTLSGPDTRYLQQACRFNSANVIASGGISNLSDVKLLQEYNPFGVILGKALYENKISIQEAKQLS